MSKLFFNDITKNIAILIDNDLKCKLEDSWKEIYRLKKKLRGCESELSNYVNCSYCNISIERQDDYINVCAETMDQECKYWCGRGDCRGADEMTHCDDCGYGMCLKHQMECEGCDLIVCNVCKGDHIICMLRAQ